MAGKPQTIERNTVSEERENPFSRRITELFAGEPLPPLLLSLTAYAASLNAQLTPGQSVSGQVRLGGSFELLWDEFDPVAGWFGDRADVAKKRFKAFGRDAVGSVYGLWVKRGVPAERAPVAVLDAEFIQDSVLTLQLREFLALLACDFGFPSAGRHTNALPAPQNGPFRAWLLDMQGIEPLREPKTTIDAAIVACPSFATWARTPR